LWVTSIVAMPVPLLIPLEAWVPAGRILMLAAVCALTMVVETTRGAVVPLAILLFFQAALAASLLWCGAHLLSRALALVSDAARTRLTLLLVLSLLMSTALATPYSDPYRPENLRTGLLHVYE
jgi:hypothetical protein